MRSIDTNALAANCTKIIAAKTEKSNIPVLKRERKRLHGTTTGSVILMQSSRMRHNGEDGFACNQLNIALINKANTIRSLSHNTKRANPKNINYLQGLVVSGSTVAAAAGCEELTATFSGVKIKMLLAIF